MRRPRRRRTPSRHISISATDADWEVVRRNAERCGLSIARYLVDLVERDGSQEDASPTLAISADGQRELQEAVREIRALMLEGQDAGPLVRDMQERIAVMFNAWAWAMAGSGRRGELRAALERVVGEERAGIAMASIAPGPVRGPKAPRSGGGETDTGQGRLF
ncbi:MAG: hypothetical protein OXE86_08020 [Alphaproteobacteria bacterium]|nr:hypothetical protein [Alphaproteobacteria bacterium]